MKKIGLMAILTLFVALMMGGCGSNTKADPIPVPPTNGYMLTNVTSPFNIGFPGEKKDFQVQLLQNGLPVSGETVTTGLLSATFGFVENTSAVTNEGGYAVFHYVAADPLTNGVRSLELVHEDENKSRVSAYLDINVVAGQTPFNYDLVNATTPILITAASQAEVISATLVNENNIGVAGKVVTISPLPSSIYGTLSPISTTTDASGKASFSYVAPTSLTGLSNVPLTISFTENGVTITQNVQIMFEKTGYNLVNVTTPIVINNGSQTTEISAYLVDKDGKGVSGQPVSISPVATGYGTVTPGVATTNDAGKAVFTYQAPLHLTGLTSTTVTLSYTDAIGIVSANVEIRIISGDDTGYQLVNAKDPYYIYSSTQPDLFDIQLIKNGLPVIDARACTTETSTVTVDCVIPDAIDRRFGRFQGIDTAGDQAEKDGYVYYRYLAPTEDEKAANGEDTTFIVLYIDQNGMIAAQSEPILLRMRY